MTARKSATQRFDATLQLCPDVQTWIGLALSLVSALAVNFAYSREHDAAVGLPPLSPRRPLHAARLLLHNRQWVSGFGLETAGWLVYVAALRLAPLSLVQAVNAAGIGVLALIVAHGDPRRLSRREQVATLAAVVGLALLGVSLVGATVVDHAPNVYATIVWLGACAGGAAALSLLAPERLRAAAYGLAAGLLFAGGDISVKLVVRGGPWLLALLSLIGFYGLGTLRLQSAFQRGDALTGAGLATLATNAMPIAAGFVLFGEALPHGASGVLQVLGFAAIVTGAILLGDKGRVGATGSSETLR